MQPVPAPLLGTRPFSQDKADTLLLMGACLLVLLPHLRHLPLWSAIVCVVLLGWRTWITFTGQRLPPRWLLLPISIGVAIGVYLSYGTFLGRDPGVMMLAMLLALKLLEMHAKRDVFVVVFLGFFLMLASFFHSQSIGAAALMITAVTVMLSAQLSFQYTGTAPSIRKRLWTSLRIVGLALPVTAILFVLVPRIEGPLWRLPGDAQAGRSGLSNTMSPGNIASLALSDAIAFRVKFEANVPPKSALYWRGPVLGHFDGRTWTPLPAGIDNAAVTLRHLGTPLRYQVTVEPHGNHWLFALEMPQGVPALSSNTARFTTDGRLITSQPVRQRLRYDLVSSLDYVLQSEAAAPALQPWLQLPVGYNPATLAFASEISQRHTTPVQRVEAVLRHFHEQAFSYTLQPPLLGKHSIDDFLFSTRAGFCEHYSSAFVVLMRVMGIPARVVTGYQGGELNNVDGFLVVRQSDAHAWAEVWLAGRGWTRVDPTAAVAPARINMNLGSAIPQPLLGGWIRLNPGENSWLTGLQSRLRQWGDAMGNSWNQWILNYTPERQRNLLQSLGFKQPDWRTLILLMLPLLLAAMAVIGWLLLRPNTPRSPLEKLFLELCDTMKAHGYPREPHEGPRSYAARLSSQGKTLSCNKRQAASRFLALYESIRYARQDAGNPGNSVPPALVSQLKSLLNECK